MKAAVALIAWLVAGAVCEAADAPPTTDWAPTEVVVVTTQAAGPALWHVKKGDSEIWILGTIGLMPKKLAWNSMHLAQVIEGARVVLAPPKATSGFFETSWFLLTHRGLLSMPDDRKLEDTLPPDLKTRFIATRGSLGLDAGKFEDDTPIVAAVKLDNRFTEANDLDEAEPWQTVEKIAREKRVPARSIGEYGALALVKELLRLPQAAQQICLTEAVGNVEQRAVHLRPLADAWATGDVKAIKAHYVPSKFDKCVKQTGSFNKLYDRAVADYMKAIQDALSKPGKVVMLADIGALLRNTGVAEQLHAQGVTIEGPGE